MNVTIVRYREIGLKGRNREWYEKKLIENIKQKARMFAIKIRVDKKFGRIMLYSEKELDFLKYVFGIASYSPAVESEVDIKKIADAAMQITELHDNLSFRGTTQRSDKSVKMTSKELSGELGYELQQRTNAEVDLTEYDVNVCVEIVSGRAYVYTDKIECFGGLPIGTQGKVCAIIENKNDELAALLMLKRGCSVIPVTETELNDEFVKYGFNAQKKIEDLNKIEAEAVITGKTFETLEKIETNKLVLRPLCGMNEREIQEKYDEFMHS
jgi:thiamine biosynthesis protein ThiI